jgi:beta-phosphoglucomutase-like phosphatase (HAD superfamily)
VKRQAFLLDLDGTLVDSVYQHVLAWQDALERMGMRLSVWRIHRKIGMSGGLLTAALLRETGRDVTAREAERLRALHAEAYRERALEGTLSLSRSTESVGALLRVARPLEPV